MKVICLLPVLSVAYAITFAQSSPASDNIEWNEFYELQWHDFQGKPGEASIGDAGTVVQIRAKPYLIKRDVQYDVTVFFVRKKSWVRDQAPSLLEHERLHFDIAEWYARKIRKKILALAKENEKDIQVYNAAINQLLEESNEIDRLYDLETLHGALDRKQKAWADKVHGELEKLDAFKRKKRIIAK